MAELCIFCWDIEIWSEKDSLVLEWFQRWQNPTFFVGDISNSKWKRQFSIEIMSKMTERCIFCCNIQIQNEKDSSVLK